MTQRYQYPTYKTSPLRMTNVLDTWISAYFLWMFKARQPIPGRITGLEYVTG